jgi:hypothetical protein
MNRTPPGDEAADLLAQYPPEVRNLAQASRAMVLRLVPGITEQVDVKARIIGYGYGPKYIDMVCMIMPTKAVGESGDCLCHGIVGPEETSRGHR